MTEDYTVERPFGPNVLASRKVRTRRRRRTPDEIAAGTLERQQLFTAREAERDRRFRGFMAGEERQARTAREGGARRYAILAAYVNRGGTPSADLLRWAEQGGEQPSDQPQRAGLPIARPARVADVNAQKLGIRVGTPEEAEDRRRLAMTARARVRLSTERARTHPKRAIPHQWADRTWTRFVPDDVSEAMRQRMARER
ncbi:MAG TPA: hypothetical protein VMW52_07550, partial [Phycisphaerae bacterium]|nr:hypothetical protein [Phycisphaerae bacterium]